VLLAAVLLWVDRPPRSEADASGAPSQAHGELITRQGALASLHFWTIAAPMALAIAVQVGFIVHQIAFLFPSLGREGAGAAVLVTAATAVFGRLVLGFFVDRLDQRRLAAGLLAAQASALFAMLQSSNPAVVYSACAVFGFGVGNMIVLPALMVQREYPPASFGMLSALVLAIVQVTNALGPVLLGGLRDVTSSYTVSIWASMLLELTAAAVVLLRIGPARMLERARRVPS
jgi:cyanate permease